MRCHFSSSRFAVSTVVMSTPSCATCHTTTTTTTTQQFDGCEKCGRMWCFDCRLTYDADIDDGEAWCSECLLEFAAACTVCCRRSPPAQQSTCATCFALFCAPGCGFQTCHNCFPPPTPFPPQTPPPPPSPPTHIFRKRRKSWYYNVKRRNKRRHPIALYTRKNNIPPSRM